MGLTSTRTHTRYFATEHVDAIGAAIDAMADEWAHRRPHVTDVDVIEAADLRLQLLNAAVALAGEPCP